MSFSTDITAFCLKTKLAPSLVLRKLGFDGLRLVMLKSPVDTGRFRANWRVGINVVDLTTLEVAQTSAPQAEAEGVVMIDKAKWGDSIFISNNLPYAEPLENGHSKQAPNGMLKISALELQRAFAAAVEYVRSQK